MDLGLNAHARKKNKKYIKQDGALLLRLTDRNTNNQRLSLQNRMHKSFYLLASHTKARILNEVVHGIFINISKVN
jgi:hypothetical protein